MSTKTLMTVEDFALMTNSDIEDFELVEGELIPLSSGNPLRADIRGGAGGVADDEADRAAGPGFGGGGARQSAKRGKA